MNFLLYVFPFFFLFYAIFFLTIGLRATVKNEPSIINSRWLYVIIVLSLLPVVIFNAINLFQYRSDSTSALIFSMVPVFFILLMIFYYFIIKGYSVYCVSDTDFRNSIIYSLNKNSIKFEEKMNKIELVEINNELNISFTAWIGSGMIKLKNKKDAIVFNGIIDSIKQYFRENSIKAKKIIAVFYLIFGAIFVLIGIGFTIFLIKMRDYI